MTLQEKYVKQKLTLFTAALRTAEDEKEREQTVLDHIKEVDANPMFEIKPELPRDVEWFNSAPLSFSGDLKGKLVVLDFFTYCCINCLHILPDLSRLEKEFPIKTGVVVVGVHSAKFNNEKLSDNIRNAIQRHNITHPVVNDVDITLWDGLGIKCWPTLVVFSPGGRVLATIVGEGHADELQVIVSMATQYYGDQLSTHDIPYEPGQASNKSSSILSYPGKLCYEKGTLYISDSGHNRILVADASTGRVLNIIGSGEEGLKDGSFSDACFSFPQGLVYYAGQLYVADTNNHALRMVDFTTSTVTTIAGTGKQGNDKEGGHCGTKQELSSPWDLVLGSSPGGDHINLLYIAMAGTHQVWAYLFEDAVWFKGVSYPASTVVAFSGSGEEANRNNSYAHKASFAQPSGLSVVLKQQRIFVADSESSTIRMVSCTDGSVKAVVGGALDPQDLFAFGDKDGKARDVRLQHPLAVVCSDDGQQVYVADSYNHKIKVVNIASKTCSTLAGVGKAALSDGDFSEAAFSEPGGLCLSGDHLYVADTNNHCVRIMDLHTKSVSELMLQLPPKRITGRRAVTIEHDRVLLSSRDEKLTMELVLSLPSGAHLNNEALSSYQILGGTEGKILLDKGKIEQVNVTLAPLNVPLDVNNLDVEIVVYVCEENGTCIMCQFVCKVPFDVASTPSTQPIKLTLDCQQ